MLKEQYEACRAEVNRADEEAQFSYQKKKGVAAERKEAKFEKEEAEKYTRLKQELVRIKLLNYILQKCGSIAIMFVSIF